MSQNKFGRFEISVRCVVCDLPQSTNLIHFFMCSHRFWINRAVFAGSISTIDLTDLSRAMYFRDFEMMTLLWFQAQTKESFCEVDRKRGRARGFLTSRSMFCVKNKFRKSFSDATSHQGVGRLFR